MHTGRTSIYVRPKVFKSTKDMKWMLKYSSFCSRIDWKGVTNIFEEPVTSWTLKIETENSTSCSYVLVHTYLTPRRHIPEKAELLSLKETKNPEMF